MRNANDGISVITIADQAVGQVTSVLNRIAELAEQSANGVIDNTQRSAIQNEFSALASEIERIAVTTKFNGLNLIRGGNDLTFQIGFDGSSTSQLTYGAVDVRLAGMGLAATGVSAPSFSVLATAGDEVQSQVAARSALDAIQLAITSVNQQRGKLGALESRLEVTINNLQVARENFKAAESRIRDVDVATEAAELTRLNILQQAGAAVLAQANQVPQLALQLLGR
jgi:flagellin